MVKYFKIVALFILTTFCTEPEELEIDQFDRVLVVEGFISTENEIHTVTLSRTAQYGSIFFGTSGVIVKEEGATVIIRDQVGKTENLTETAPGVYQTDGNFSAEFGNTYNLLIELANGSSYISLPDTVSQSLPIDSLEYSFDEIQVDETTSISGFDVKVRFTDPGDANNYYLWRAEGLYEMFTRPDLHVVTVPPPGFGTIPAPKDCCNTCWRTENFDSNINIANDNLFDGNSLSQSILFVEDDGLRFTQGPYLTKVRQYSISAEAYNFMRLIESQSNIDGDIFDPPPATVRGNIISLDNPDEVVVGFFWTAGISIDSVYLDPANLEFMQEPVQINDDCRLFSGTTTIRPIFWEN